ncbi:hypothetical protein [Microbacterium immunditiarum]|uniref:Uncharacterized protein n=1 Tax=Microbacterium immunditiarum TaxID=337480 RepID=A0A7Y9KKC3_9MICO|nr:hypothetical protein [Microbacterium immunditiarum]NYE20586.1 hypothetical protein [Microbacterium immunditiarum]
MLAVGLMAAGVAMAATPAVADEGDRSDETVVINGREFGPEDGLEVITESYEMKPGGEPVGAEFPSAPTGEITPLVYWGSSYAYAEEILYLMYRGYGYAAANVYSGKRIISVCFWWTRAGVRLSPNTCSNAWSTGSSWNPGLQVGRDQWDTLDPNAPPTVFNIQTTRIDPGIYWAASWVRPSRGVLEGRTHESCTSSGA